ncbi:MAG: hypothetical protein V4591_02150 [Bdellovibrionota bacterium]
MVSSIVNAGILVVFVLVVTSIVPNSFSISLIGFGLCIISICLKQPNSFLDRATKQLNHRTLVTLIFAWVLLIILAGCVNAWARFVSPGYDLYWFTQAITQAKTSGILKTSSERFYSTMLMQHWEPILYSAVPLAFVVKSSVLSALWQGLGFLIGSLGAFKLSQFLFSQTKYLRMQYVTTALFVWSFATINPLSFDVHPPVFGGLLFIPWIIYCIVTQKNKIIPVILLLLLAQCGEVFLAIFTTYVGYLFVQHKVTFSRVILSVLAIASGYLILSFYQKYLGPWWSDLPYNYASRYGNIGGDGFGIISNFIQHPLYVLSQVFEKEKIKTFLKILLYSGPFFIFSFKSSQYARLSFFILLGCIPYFLQAGLSSYNLLYATNTHYIGALGSQWWALTTLGLYAFLTEDIFQKMRSLCFKTSVVSLILSFFFLNSSEWRKSPIYPFRGVFEREISAKNVRNYLENLDKRKGILFIDTEWLCPIAAFERPWIICNDGSGYFDKIPLDVVVVRENSLEQFYNRLSENSKNSMNGKVLQELILQSKNSFVISSWQEKFSSSQKPHKDRPIFYRIYERQQMNKGEAL